MRMMLVGAVMVACLAPAARADEASAVKMIMGLGGKIDRDNKLTGKPVVKV